MTGVTGILIKLGVRFVVFTATFWLVAKKHDRVVFERRWAPPLVALVFAVLDTALYWALKPVLSLATLGAASFAVPLIVNVVLLVLTARLFKKRGWFRLDGVFATLWMAIGLTIAHGGLWLGLDYLPKHF